MSLPAIGTVGRKLDSALRRVREDGPLATCTHALLFACPRYLGLPWIQRAAPLVYVGPQHRFLGKQFLRLRGFRNSVNLRENFDDARHGLTLGDYCYPPKGGRVPFLDQLVIGVAFIAEKAERGEKVYVHCTDGLLRARALAAAYLVYKGRHPEEALRSVRAREPQRGVIRKYLYEFQARHT